MTIESVSDWNLNDCHLFLDITAMKRLLIIITTGISMLLPGCAGMFQGSAGVGTGAFSNIAGNLTRIYEAEYQQSIRACVNVVEPHSFSRKKESPEALKIIIEGYLNNDTPVNIEVIHVDPGRTRIGVRTAHMGGNNLEISEQVHSDIARELESLMPRPLQASSHKNKVEKPLTPQKTSDKKELNSYAIKHGSSQTRYDDLISPPLSDTVAASMKNHIDDTQETIVRQEKVAQSHTESKTKTFIYYPKSELTIYSGSYDVLDDVISYLDSSPSSSVNIRTYTDFPDNSARNQALSRKRVSDIRNYMIIKGISEEKITAQIQDATDFFESNRTEQLRSLNTVVELTIR